MSLMHIHLLLNHFPVIGGLIGIALVATALLRRSSELSRASLGLFAALGVISVIVFLTGEPAEEAIEKLPGFSEAITEKHEEAALVATVAMAALGALALGALAWFRNRDIPRWIATVAFVFSLGAGTAMSYTAMLGGQVRHTEVRGSVTDAARTENPD